MYIHTYIHISMTSYIKTTLYIGAMSLILPSLPPSLHPSTFPPPCTIHNPRTHPFLPSPKAPSEILLFGERELATCMIQYLSLSRDRCKMNKEKETP